LTFSTPSQNCLYSKDIVYNNFPWPKNITEKQRKKVEEKAEKILSVRENFPENSLATLYNPLTMPPELVKAHQELDRVVDLCYRPNPFPNETTKIEIALDQIYPIIYEIILDIIKIICKIFCIRRCVMNTVRLNITLPLDAAEILKNVKNKSAFIAEAIREYKRQKDKEKLVNELREGYIATKEEDSKIYKEWENTIGDGIV
jgi:hypothetical protein